MTERAELEERIQKKMRELRDPLEKIRILAGGEATTGAATGDIVAGSLSAFEEIARKASAAGMEWCENLLTEYGVDDFEESALIISSEGIEWREGNPPPDDFDRKIPGILRRARKRFKTLPFLEISRFRLDLLQKRLSGDSARFLEEALSAGGSGGLSGGAAAAAGLTGRGADPGGKLYEDLDHLRREAEAELEIVKKLIQDANDDGAPELREEEKRRNRLENLVERLKDRVTSKYLLLTKPAPTKGGSMFSGIKNRAQKKQEDVKKKETKTLSATVIRCPNCGGPRLDEQVFICEFCGLKFGESGDFADFEDREE